MGRYIDWTDVSNKYADFAKVGGSQETGSPFIAPAEDDIDGYLAVKYSVPFTPCPSLVKDLCVDLTYYKATIRQKGAKDIWDAIWRRIAAINSGTLLLVVSGTVLDVANAPQALRVAYVSSVPPVGGSSVEDACFFDRPQS